MRRMRSGSESTFEGRLIRLLWTVAFLAALAAFSITFLTHSNTFAIAEPLIRRIAPHASPAETAALHILGRKLGHFLIPMAGYLILAMGPLRHRRFTALGLCAVFAILDESVQAFAPARSASIYDVALDLSGALFGFFLHSALIVVRSRTGRCRTGASKAQAKTLVGG
jgi:VanZ family protein